MGQGSDSTRAPPQKNGWGQRPAPTTNQRPALSTNQDADRRVETIEGAAGQAGNALSSIKEKGVYCVIMVELGDIKTKVVVAQFYGTVGKWGFEWIKKMKEKTAPWSEMALSPSPLSPDKGKKVFLLALLADVIRGS